MYDQLTPGVLALLAVLSIGGLILVGAQQANVIGQVVQQSYSACCTIDTWQHAPTGFIQGEAKTGTAQCYGGENVESCCMREASRLSATPIRLLGASIGVCSSSPSREYPVWVR